MEPRFLYLLSIWAFAPAQSAQDSLRVVAGRVRDQKARKLAGAEVMDAERRILGTTDADGWFAWGLTDTVTVFLTEAAQSLPDLEIEARPWKPVRYAGTPKYDDFFRRQRLGLGSYLSREQLDRKPAIQTLEYLQGIPGVRITIGPPGAESANNIKIVRCSGSGAKVTVWVDGVRLIGRAPKPDDPGPTTAFGASSETPRDVIDMLNRIPPADIEMIEVYRDRWNAPVETRDSVR
jgi:hypothetical protein